MKFKAIIYDGTCIILTGTQKSQRGKNKTRQGSVKNQTLVGNQIFMAGHYSTSARQCFSGVVAGACVFGTPGRRNKNYIYKPDNSNQRYKVYTQ